MSAARGASLALLLAFAVMAVMAGPVILAPSERLFGDGTVLSPGDPNRDALVVIDQFRTGHVPPPYLQPLTDLPGQALSRFVGPVVAYNLVVLSSFPFAAAAAYLLGRHVTGSHPAAMVSGLAYAFTPFHVLQAGGHPHAAQTQWLPLYLLALFRLIDRPSSGRALTLAAATAAVALADFYAGFIAATLSPFALLAYALGSRNKSPGDRLRRTSVAFAVLAAIFALGLLALYARAPVVFDHPESFSFARSELFTWSARWWSYLIPPVDHPLWGPSVSDFWLRHGVSMNLVEHQQVSLSLGLIALSSIPLWEFLRGGRMGRATRIAPTLAVVAAAALVCSLSPERQIGSFTFVRPSSWLYEVAPMFRAYARFSVVVGLMIALLSGAGALSLWRSGGAMRRAFVALALAGAVLEYAPFPPWRSRDVLPTSAHRDLAVRRTQMRILDCVLPVRVSDTLAVPLLGHEVSFLGSPGLDDCGEPHLGEKLAALRYTGAVVRRDSEVGAWFSRGLPPRNESEPVAPGGTSPFSDAWFLTMTPGSVGPYVKDWTGFYPREYEGRRTWRWMQASGTLRFVMPRDSNASTLEIELRSFPSARRVFWKVNDQSSGEFEVTPAWGRFDLPISRPGLVDTTLTLTCVEPAVTATPALENHDPRALGLAVGGLTFRRAPQ